MWVGRAPYIQVWAYLPLPYSGNFRSVKPILAADECAVPSPGAVHKQFAVLADFILILVHQVQRERYRLTMLVPSGIGFRPENKITPSTILPESKWSAVGGGRATNCGQQPIFCEVEKLSLKTS